MKKVLLFLIALIGFGVGVNAQDIILKKDGSEIKTKVLEISDQQIRYKDYDFLEGPTRVINISEIFMITYANGRKEVFNTQTKQSPPQQVQEPVQRQLTNKTHQTDNGNLSANEFENGGLLSAEGMKVFHGGVELSKFEVQNLMKNTNALNFYDSGLKKYHTGNNLLWSGVGATAVGAILAGIGGSSTSDYSYNYADGSYGSGYSSINVVRIVGLGVGIVGIGVGITGFVLKEKGKNQVAQSVEMYNNRKYTSLIEYKFGLTSNGIGLAITF